MPDWVRDKALLSMTSPLEGEDALIPTRLDADEGISFTSEFNIDAVSQIGVVDADKLLNKPICVTLRDANGPVRYFHGIAQDVTSLGSVRGKNTAEEFQRYHILAVTRLWFLYQTHDYRIYLNKSTKDILTSLFTDAGLTDVTFSVSSNEVRPYTAQYDESDYSFAKRLMEEEGWFYFFEHTAAKHTLIVADANSAFKDIPNGKLRFTVNASDADGITKWHIRAATTTGAYKSRDYDPENPGTELQRHRDTLLKTTGAASRDMFHWPARTHKPDVVEKRAGFFLEAVEALLAVRQGNSRFGGLVPGGNITIADDATYYIRSASHLVRDDSWLTSDGTISYENKFSAAPAATPYRDRPDSPKPVAAGVHTGLVLGPQNDTGGTIKMQDGEEIFTDDLARVKVRFFWDHRAEATGSASAWARVIQPWAGNGWGAQFLPRVGTEVAVAFVDADPDQPVILGGLYNGVSAPIYSKADSTKSGFRTRSSLKGSATKFNELTFDDKSGKELIFIHAEKDLTTEVEHDETLTVDNCRVVTVKADETITVKGKQTITVTKDYTFEVKEGDSAVTITKGASTFLVSKGDRSEKIAMGKHSLEVSQGDHTMKVGMGNHSTEVSMGNHDLKVPMGNVTVKASLGKIAMEAMQSIELKVGPSSIKIDPMGITIKGMMVKVEGTVMTDIKGLMTSVKGDAMLTLKGAITMIN